MATNSKAYLPTHPGPVGTRRVADYHIPPEDSVGAYMAAFPIGELFEKNTFPKISGAHAYTAAQWTVTEGGTGDAYAEATTAGGGLLITCPSDDDFNMSLQSKQLWTPVADKCFSAFFRIQVSDATGIGFHLGFGNTQVLPFTTDFTDKVMIQKAIASALVVGSVRGNSGTAAASGTLGTIVAATEIEVGFECIIGASAALSRGTWFYNGTATSFTADQRTQLFAILTTPPSVFFTIDATGVTATTPTITVTSAVGMVDN